MLEPPWLWVPVRARDCFFERIDSGSEAGRALQARGSLCLMSPCALCPCSHPPETAGSSHDWPLKVDTVQQVPVLLWYMWRRPASLAGDCGPGEPAEVHAGCLWSGLASCWLPAAAGAAVSASSVVSIASASLADAGAGRWTMRTAGCGLALLPLRNRHPCSQSACSRAALASTR